MTAAKAPKLKRVPFRSHLGGRMRNIGKPRDWLMAIAEAVKNAMDSLEDKHKEGGKGGRIEVELSRVTDLVSDQTTSAVQNVIIRDTGTGFHEDNWESFCTPDSLYKVKRGGKGLGR